MMELLHNITQANEKSMLSITSCGSSGNTPNSLISDITYTPIKLPIKLKKRFFIHLQIKPNVQETAEEELNYYDHIEFGIDYI